MVGNVSPATAHSDPMCSTYLESTGAYPLALLANFAWFGIVAW